MRREASWAIANLICGGTDQQVHYVINQGCIRPLVDNLDSQDPKLITVLLDGLLEILAFGVRNSHGNRNPCAEWIEEAGGVQRIELLQHHESTKIYKKAHRIIDTYFQGSDNEDDDQDDVDEDVAPHIAEGGQAYEFSASQPTNGWDL